MKTLFKTTGMLLAAVVFSTIFSACQMWESKEERQIKLLGLDDPGLPSDMPLNVLIDKIEKATDPNGVFKTAESYRLKQRIVNQQAMVSDAKKLSIDEHEQEILFQKPDHLKQIASRNENPYSILIFKDNQAWSVNPDRLKSEKLEGLRLELCRTFLGMADPSKTPDDIFPDIKLSVVYQDKKRYYRMVCRAANPAIAPYVIYIDDKTYLTAKGQTILYGDNGEERLYTSESLDYTLDDNVKIAYTTLITVSPCFTFPATPTVKEICTVTDFTVNLRLPPDTFSLPKPFASK